MGWGCVYRLERCNGKLADEKCKNCQRVAELELMLLDLKFDRDCLRNEKLRILQQFNEYKRKHGGENQ